MRFLALSVIEISSLIIGLVTALIAAWRGMHYWSRNQQSVHKFRLRRGGMDRLPLATGLAEAEGRSAWHALVWRAFDRFEPG